MTARSGIVCAAAFAIGLATSGDQAFGSKGRPAKMPDLIVAALGVPRAPASGSLAVRASIRNSGRARSGRSLTGFYLSSDRRRSRGDHRLGARRVAALPRRRVSRGVARLIVPATTRPGSYFVVACADDGGNVRERSERNNCRTSGKRVLLSDASSPLDPPRNPPLYGPSSPFNTPIPADPPIDPNSSLYIGGLREVAGQRGLTISVRAWTVPSYEASTATPRYDVQLTEPWRAANWMLGVPIPSEAAPDPEGDGHMTVLDRGSGCEFDFYQARHENGQWTAGWANTVRTTESGVYPFSYSMRGSGFANLEGLIWPQELGTGEIRHALMFSYPYTSAAGAVEPATETDGQSTRGDALPEGARLQLDPTLDLNSLPLQPYERTIARALQRYGMYLGDTGGGINLYAIHPQSYPSDPYVGLLPPEPYPPLPNIPIDRFRVIDLGPVTPGWILQSRARLVPTGCATMRW